MSRAFFAGFTFSILILAISCAKPESKIPPTAISGESTTDAANAAAERERQSRQRRSEMLDAGLEAEKSNRTGEAPKRSSSSASEGIPDGTAGTRTDSAPAANDQEKPVDVETGNKAQLIIADGALSLTAPSDWQKVTAASNMIEVEFTVPGESEQSGGRVTGMSAGGSVEMNISRWYDQFSQPDGSPSKDHAKLAELTVGDLKVHTMDIQGTFLEGMGPLAPKTEREDYRMLAAIIEMEGDFKYFLKFYGPAALVEKNAESFAGMLNSLKPVD